MNRHDAAILRHAAHRYLTRVYYADTDAGGVVYHATYLDIAERARTEALREMGVPHAEMAALHGLSLMVRRVNLDYVAPGRLDDALVVATCMTSLQAASFWLRQTIAHADVTKADRPLVVADVQLVCVRLADMRPARLPERWRAALASLAEGED